MMPSISLIRGPFLMRVAVPASRIEKYYGHFWHNPRPYSMGERVSFFPDNFTIVLFHASYLLVRGIVQCWEKWFRRYFL
jgi:hypothetical protein